MKVLGDRWKTIVTTNIGIPRHTGRDPGTWEPTHAQIVSKHIGHVAAQAPCYEMAVAVDLVRRLAKQDDERQRAHEADVSRRKAGEFKGTTTPFMKPITVSREELERTPPLGALALLRRQWW